MKFEIKKNKYHQILFGLNLKQVIITLPKILALFVALLSLFGIASFTLIKFQNQSEAQKVKVALVSQDNSWWMKTLEGYIEKEANCKFIEMEKDDALKALENEEITAVLILPKDVISAIMSSQDGAATLIFQYPGQFTSLKTFQNLAKTGMADIAALDSAEKLISRIQERENGRINYKEVFKIEDKLIIKVLTRYTSFDIQFYSDTGNLNLIQFMIGNLILALVLFTGIFLQELLTRKSDSYLISLNRIGISPFQVSLYQYLAVICVYTLFFYIVYTICSISGLIKFSAASYISILVFNIDTLGLLLLCYQLCKNKFTASLIVFLGSFIMMFFSGNIIPLSLLPKAASYLSPFLPTKYISQLIGEVIANTVSFSAIFTGILLAVIFIVIQWLNCKLRNSK